MKEVKSSNISHVGYENGILSVRFKSNPEHVYDYKATPDEHDAFVNAESIGKHFHQNFKSREFSKRKA